MLIPDEESLLAVDNAIGRTELPADTSGATTGEVIRAALSTENVLGSLVVKEFGMPDSHIDNPEFNPFELMTEQEKDDPIFSENAMMADTTEELSALRRQFTKERKNREILNTSGSLGVVASMGAAVFDPVNLIPVGGVAYKTYRTGGSVLAGGMATGSVALGSTAIQEAGLHSTQLTRTFDESAINMGGAMLLGGTLGAGIAKLTQPQAAKVAADIEDVMDVEPKMARGEDSVGAARVIEDVKIKGKVARNLAKVLGFDPLSRTLLSESPVTRKMSALLAESPYELDSAPLTAVQSKIKIKDGLYVKSMENNDLQFKAMRKAGGKMSKKEFNEQVSFEQRNPGSINSEFVKKAAEKWESELYAPIRNQAIEAKILPDDVSIDTAGQYLNRVWNRQKLAANFDTFVEKTAKWLEVQRGADLEKAEYTDLARQIGQRIMSEPGHRLPYDYKIGENASSGFSSKMSGTFKKRSFDVKDSDFQEFLENDIEELGRRYLRGTAADIEFVKEFGDVEMKAALAEVQDYWANKMLDKSLTEKQRLKMQKQSADDMSDLTDMNLRIRGKFDVADPNNPWVRTGRAIRDLNYLRLMGGVMAASFSDMARIVMAEGMADTFSKGLVPMVKNIKGFKASGGEAREYGVASETILSGRSTIISDIEDYTIGGTAIERGLHSMAQGYGKINILDAWTSGAKQLHISVMQNKVIPGMKSGKFDKRLERLGISADNQRLIGEQLKKHATNDNGFWLANRNKWTDPDLQELYAIAMRKESDRVILIPGEEKPLFMSNNMGKTFFQFKSFMFASTQRILIAGVQGQDAHYMQGLVGMTSLGMMTYAFKQWDAGRELSDDPSVWVMEGIDRSGMLGSLMEVNNTIEKLSNNSMGMRPVLGVSTPSSRFASRNNWEAMMGPTFGSFLSTALRVAGSASDENPWGDSDTRALRRLLPYQNLMIFRQLLDKIEEQL